MASRKTEEQSVGTGIIHGSDTAAPPPATTAMPPEHVDHAAVYYNEHAIRKQGFEAGLAAIDAEIEGKRIEREEKIAAIERDYASDMASLERRRTMMVIGIEMAGAALAKFEELKEPDNAAPAAQEAKRPEDTQ